MQASQPEPIPGAASAATPLAMPVSFLRLGDVMRVTGLGRSTVYRLMAERRFPPPCRPGRTRGWLAQFRHLAVECSAPCHPALVKTKDAVMSLWDRMKAPQLELLDASPQPQPQLESESESESESRPSSPSDASTGLDLSAIEPLSADLRPPSEPLLLPLAALFEDPANPRTEFPQAELDELAEDIRQHGILQPIVVHPADATGRFCIHFGAKRFRAAARAELSKVPVTVRQADADPYAQVAENQKRHGLSPLDLARFIRSRVDQGETNAAIAGRLGIDLTTVAHHLALLELPPPLDAALKSGRCVSPRTLYELRKVHAKQPGAIAELLQGDKPITREAAAALLRPARQRRGPAHAAAPRRTAPKQESAPDMLAARAERLCTQLASTCSRLRSSGFEDVLANRLAALRDRVDALKVLLDP